MATETTGRKPKGRPPKVADLTQTVPAPKAQRDFTDPGLRIMEDGATKGYAQAAVDCAAQIIVAATCAEAPAVASTDSGCFNAAAMTADPRRGIDLFVAVDRQPHGDVPEPPGPADGTVTSAMRAKLQTAAGHAVYALRKAIVEPVFGQIKAGRGFRRFAFRGFGKVQTEWQVICLTHNLRKLFRAGWTPQTA